jgi:hypothetical protein
VSDAETSTSARILIDAAATSIRGEGRNRIAPLSMFRVSLALVAGCVIGLSACSLFLLAVRAFGSISIGIVAASMLGAVAAGSIFSALLAVARGERVGWVHILGLGLAVLAVGTSALMVPIFAESAVQNVNEPVGLFRAAFTTASTLMAVVCTAIASWMFGARGWRTRALLVGAVTGVTYLAVALAIDPVPGLHVGGGNMAMPKVAAICNFVAGFVGGTVAHLALSRRAKRHQAAVLNQPPD